MSVLIFILVLLVLIVGHEFGHFITAKLAKMKVLEFGVGFPPKIFGKKFSPEGTEYSVNWLPFGGFVRLFGEDDDEKDHPQAFSNHKAYKQALVLFAGPFANVLMALVLFFAALVVGTPALIDDDQAVNARDVRVVVGEVLLESPAATAGLEPGDHIQTISYDAQTHTVDHPNDLSEHIAQANGAVTLQYDRGGVIEETTIEPITGLVSENPEQKAIGVGLAFVGTVSFPFHEAVVRAFTQTINATGFVVVSFVTLIASAFTLTADVSHIAGPVGIATLTGDALQFGIGSLLSFAALLSINLAIINLFPFPALDGGRLLFLGIETATRRKIPRAVAQGLNTAGFAILILLMIAVTIGDITRLVS